MSTAPASHHRAARVVCGAAQSNPTNAKPAEAWPPGKRRRLRHRSRPAPSARRSAHTAELRQIPGAAGVAQILMMLTTARPSKALRAICRRSLASRRRRIPRATHAQRQCQHHQPPDAARAFVHHLHKNQCSRKGKPEGVPKAFAQARSCPPASQATTAARRSKVTTRVWRCEMDCGCAPERGLLHTCDVKGGTCSRS